MSLDEGQSLKLGIKIEGETPFVIQINILDATKANASMEKK